jgi:DNA gyrase/topoisomerase IV subunit A
VGRQIAFSRRDELLRLICLGDSPSEKLISELGLTQKQASDILGLNLEYFKRSKALEIEDELIDIRARISELCRASVEPNSQYAVGKTIVTQTLSKEDFWRNNAKRY